MNRRTFCRRVAAVTVASLAIASPASAESADWADDGDEITRSDDEAELLEYLPYLRYETGSPSREQLIGIYGWKAESPDYETDAYYFWARYTHQNAGAEHFGPLERAAGYLASDAHLFDHEPSITFVDPSTGDVEEVVYTQGHHSVARETDPPLMEGDNDQPTHVSLRVVDPWHHYDPDEEKRGVDVRNFAEFGSFLKKRDAWRDNGFYENSSAEAIDNPWTARERDTWFEDSFRDWAAAKMWGFL